MGGRAGGGGAGLGSRAGGGGLARGETEAGYSAALSRSVLKAESEIKNQTNETVVIFNDDGSVAFRKDGTRMGVTYDGRKSTDKVMTHNHPGPDAPFSSSDLRDAVKFNQKEVRAVSRNYTYSMKRPQGGWGSVKPDAVMRTYSTIKRQVAKEWDSRISSASSGAGVRTEYFKSQIEVQRRLAKKFGWDFSYKKNK
jgi:hypothetical protein